MSLATEQSVHITSDDAFLFAEGTWYESYNKLGAHEIELNGEKGFFFSVWAPGVRAVYVVGDFNDWHIGAHELHHVCNGVWECFVAGAHAGQAYKFFIETHSGLSFYKADPYARFCEVRPKTASILQAPSTYTWSDAAYRRSHAHFDALHKPLNIFECHLGSWKRKPSDADRQNAEQQGENQNWEWTCRGDYYSYNDLTRELVPYVKKMGYSHIEIMPIMEHPFDGSWGYQITGYYAPTSRFGTPDEFKHFIDTCHQEGIGVILDWVPGGFCKDAHGLGRFNGERLYELGEHPNWGTYMFDFGRGEVRSFLISNASFWLDEYHVDGIRVDGVSSMLYLNFGIDDPAQKKYNARGTEENDTAVAFLRQCNTALSRKFPYVLLIAEESTAWPLVSYPPEVGGLGFHFKWDMGWMNDTLHYIQCDFPFRCGAHNLLTFTTMYQFDENFILPLSHDEVVHGKCSLIRRQPGDYWRQFAGMRALALYQMTHAGGKLNFMGNEIAQFIEWRYYEGIQYFLPEHYESHRAYQHYIQELNNFYNKHAALWIEAFSSKGFSWIDADNNGQSIISFMRLGHKSTDDVLVLINFSVEVYHNFRIGVPHAGYWQEAFSSDELAFGGSGVVHGSAWLKTDLEPAHGQPQSLVMDIPPLAGVIVQFKRRFSQTTLKAMQDEMRARLGA